MNTKSKYIFSIIRSINLSIKERVLNNITYIRSILNLILDYLISLKKKIIEDLN